MYILQQIKRQFVSILMAHQLGGGLDTNMGGAQKSVEPAKKLSPEQRMKLSNLEELQRDLEAIKAGENYLGKMLERYGSGLEKIATGQEPGYSIEDPEYKELKAKYVNFMKSYGELVEEKQVIGHIVTLRLAELTGEVGEQIQELRESGNEKSDEAELTDTQGENLSLLESKYTGYTEALSMKLSPYVGKDNNSQSLQDSIHAFQSLDTQSQDMSPKERLHFLETEALIYVKELNTLADIALRDNMNVGDTGKKLEEVRMDNTHEAYNEILKDEAIKKSITSKNGKTPRFDELEMNHIQILKEKGVNLAKLFLTDTTGKAFSGTFQEGKSYIVNFSTNKVLSGEMNFSFFTHEVDEIKINGEKYTFQENKFSQEGKLGLMKDGSKIDIVKFSEEPKSPEVLGRIEGIATLLDQYSVSDTKRQVVQEALASYNPTEAFKGMTLPGGLGGLFLSMLLKFLQGKDFQYNEETGTYEEVLEGGTLTNGQVIDQSIGKYQYNGKGVDISTSFEGLPPGVGGLVNIIYQAEANGNPNIIYAGCPIQPPKPITEMTVAEVRRFQDKMVAAQSGRKDKSSAVGACQIIRKTMDAAISSGLLDPNEKFDVSAQMKFTLGKMKERGLDKFIAGDPNMGEQKFMGNLSKEWASLPKDMSGVSYHAGNAGNAARVNPQVVLRQLREIRG